jgi:hypothetical protein
MASVAQLKQIIKKNKAGQYWEDYGPFKIGTATVCEIWTIGDGEDPEGPLTILKYVSRWKVRAVRKNTSNVLVT